MSTFRSVKTNKQTNNNCNTNTGVTRLSDNSREMVVERCLVSTSLFLPQDINKEQTLLEREQSQSPMLQTLMANKQPYDQLWTTALNFHSKSEVWMNGWYRPFYCL